MDTAGEHDMGGADAAARRLDSLAHAVRIDRHRRRMLENMRPGLLRAAPREPERVIEGMQVEGARDNGAR